MTFCLRSVNVKYLGVRFFSLKLKQNESSSLEAAIIGHNVSVVAIGNGCGSVESEQTVKKTIMENSELRGGLNCGHWAKRVPLLSGGPYLKSAQLRQRRKHLSESQQYIEGKMDH